MDCSYCKPAGFLQKTNLHLGPEQGEILACNFPFLEGREEELKAAPKALLHSRLPTALFERSALEIKKSGATAIVLVDQPGEHLREIVGSLDRIGLDADFLISKADRSNNAVGRRE